VRIAVASGKGGTGKTTVAVNLAAVMGAGCRLYDCDVEEPNAHLFLRGEKVGEEVVTVPLPVVDEGLCDRCGACADFCAYGALVILGTEVLVFPELCHGCGGCRLVCPRGAVTEVPRRIGVVETIHARGITLRGGRLDVGVPMAPPLVRAVRAGGDGGGIAVIDAPPGASCPVVAAVRDTDLVLLVAEPTPFGLHDLKIAVETTKALGLRAACVINRAGGGDGEVRAYCGGEGIPVLMEIPEDRRVAEIYSRGGLVVEHGGDHRARFEDLAKIILAGDGRKES